MSWTTHPVDHIMDPWIHSSCSPGDGDELRSNGCMLKGIAMYSYVLLSLTPLPGVGPSPPSIRAIHGGRYIHQCHAHGWWWTPSSRPLILEISMVVTITAHGSKDPVLWW